MQNTHIHSYVANTQLPHMKKENLSLAIYRMAQMFDGAKF